VRPQLAALCALCVSGCTFGIRLCDVDADCGAGSSCDGATGVCVTDEGVPAPADEPPGKGHATEKLSLEVPLAPSRPVFPGVQLEDAWLRGDRLFVGLEATGELTDVRLTVAGLDAEPAPADACAGACAGTCYCFAVDLAKPALPGLRGSFALVGSGLDSEGQRLTAEGALNVTRLAWRRSLTDAVRATPAIGSDGTLYVGTAKGDHDGSLQAISPSGEELWSKSLGRIEASPTLGAAGGAAQHVFVGSMTNAGLISALDATGTLVDQCVLSKDAELEASPASMGSGAAFFSSKARALIAFRPGLSPACLITPTDQDIAWPDTLVSSGGAVFYVDNKPSVHRFDLGATGWVKYAQTAWPGLPQAGYRNHGLALTGAGKLLGAGQLQTSGTVFQAGQSGAFKFDFGFTPLVATAPATGPVVAADGTVLFGIPTGIAALSSAGMVVGAGDSLANTPALGQGGRLYALAANGSLSEWTYGNGRPLRSWSASLETADATVFEASPALDCARTTDRAVVPGRPGRLYAVSTTGALYAIDVDARGLDTTAEWPKYQKDARNSGSADTSLAEFACP
jgi:outer membrane protein assembly factor BamB